MPTLIHSFRLPCLLTFLFVVLLVRLWIVSPYDTSLYFKVNFYSQRHVCAFAQA